MLEEYVNLFLFKQNSHLYLRDIDIMDELRLEKRGIKGCWGNFFHTINRISGYF